MVCNKRNALILSILTLMIVFLQFWHFDQTVEDSWITLNYARNFLHGLGLVIVPYGDHQEGFSNLSLVVAEAALGRLGIDLLIAAKIIGIASVATSFLLAASLMQKEAGKGRQILPIAAFATAYALSPGCIYWSSSGLETTLYSAVLISSLSLFFSFCQKPSYKKIVLIVLFCMLALVTRPEGIVYFIYFFALTALVLFLRRSDRSVFFNYLFFWMIVSSASIAIYFSWRLVYFGQLLSNPAYVKLTLSQYNSTHERLNYIIGYFREQGWWYFIGSFVELVYVLKKATLVFGKSGGGWSKDVPIISMSVFGIMFSEVFFVIYAGSDYMGNYRFLAPITPFYMISVIFGYQKIAQSINKYFSLNWAPKVVMATLIVGAALRAEATQGNFWKFDERYLKYASDISYASQRDGVNINGIEIALKASGGTVYAHSEFGYIPYHIPGKIAIDMMGLNDKIIARNYEHYGIYEGAKASRDYVLSQQPEIISTYGYYKTLGGGVKTIPGVGWFFAPYFDSRFFMQNYDISYESNPGDDTLLINRFKHTYAGVSFLDSASLLRPGDKHCDQLMDGFYFDGDHIWVADHSRILISQSSDAGHYLVINGWLPDIGKYKDSKFVLKVASVGEYVGSDLFGIYKTNQSGMFSAVYQMPLSMLNERNVLVDIRGSIINQKGDARPLSWVMSKIYIR